MFQKPAIFIWKSNQNWTFDGSLKGVLRKNNSMQSNFLLALQWKRCTLSCSKSLNNSIALSNLCLCLKSWIMSMCQIVPIIAVSFSDLGLMQILLTRWLHLMAVIKTYVTNLWPGCLSVHSIKVEKEKNKEIKKGQKEKKGN